jgi:hypothetical protein
MAIANKHGRLDSLSVEFEADIVPFEVCAATFRPIYPGTTVVRSAFSGTAYRSPQVAPAVDVVSEFEAPGQPATGLLLF